MCPLSARHVKETLLRTISEERKKSPKPALLKKAPFLSKIFFWQFFLFFKFEDTLSRFPLCAAHRLRLPSGQIHLPLNVPPRGTLVLVAGELIRASAQIAPPLTLRTAFSDKPRDYMLVRLRRMPEAPYGLV